MPTYEYKCKAGHETSRTCPMHEAKSWVKCPECGKRANLVYVPPNIIFKGGGWPSKSFRRGEKLA